MLSKEVQWPARASFWWIAARQRDKVGFFTSVEFALVDAVGLAAINRREAVFGVAFAVTTNSAGVTSDGLTDLSGLRNLCTSDLVAKRRKSLNRQLSVRRTFKSGADHSRHQSSRRQRARDTVHAWEHASCAFQRRAMRSVRLVHRQTDRQRTSEFVAWWASEYFWILLRRALSR